MSVRLSKVLGKCYGVRFSVRLGVVGLVLGLGLC